jgi:thiol-disulfide isomerase/thioredoxin
LTTGFFRRDARDREFFGNPDIAGASMPPDELCDYALRANRLPAIASLAATFLLFSGCSKSAAPSADSTQNVKAEAVSPPQSDSEVSTNDTVGARDTTGMPDESVAKPAEPQPSDPPAKDDPNDPFPRKFRLPAAALEGGVEWLNAAGPITLDSLRGKIVILDFWTYCCINCMHVLPDLKKLEEKYPNELVVIGVHSAKFDAERDSQNIREAILRYEIKHPVVNDADMLVWRKFGIRAWPSLCLIDPEGNYLGVRSGEGIFEDFDLAIDQLLKYHRAKGTLKSGPVHFELEATKAADTPLRFPGKVLADAASDRLYIADSNHNRIVVATLAGKLVDVIGSGSIGRDDGPFDKATFFRPQGLALDGGTLYVADTENHMIRRVDLKARTVSTVAGTGEQGQSRSHAPRPARTTALNSPWDLCWRDGRLYIAMAGPHQIWVWNAAADEIHAYAGSGREDIVDGELEFAAFAQPSGLATDGEWLYVADSEGSSIRAVPFDPEREVRTVVGTAHLPGGRLFEFGDEDGEGEMIRLQHPLGIACWDGAIYVADTYNNKIKQIDPTKLTSATYVGTGASGRGDEPPQLDEPGGLSAAAGKLYVADTNNHAIRVVELATRKVATLAIDGLQPPKLVKSAATPSFPNARRIELAEQTLAANSAIELRVRINLEDGFALNDLAPATYLVETAESNKLLGGESVGRAQSVRSPETSFTIPLTTADGSGTTTLRVSLTYFQCREGASGICEVKSVVWEIPVRLAPDSNTKHIDVATPTNPSLPAPDDREKNADQPDC